jgi:CCR4-NOT transcriptional regulation complex NOT5 subunit
LGHLGGCSDKSYEKNHEHRDLIERDQDRVYRQTVGKGVGTSDSNNNPPKTSNNGDGLSMMEPMERTACMEQKYSAKFEVNCVCVTSFTD